MNGIPYWVHENTPFSAICKLWDCIVHYELTNMNMNIDLRTIAENRILNQVNSQVLAPLSRRITEEEHDEP